MQDHKHNLHSKSKSLATPPPVIAQTPQPTSSQNQHFAVAQQAMQQTQQVQHQVTSPQHQITSPQQVHHQVTSAQHQVTAPQQIQHQITSAQHQITSPQQLQHQITSPQQIQHQVTSPQHQITSPQQLQHQIASAQQAHHPIMHSRIASAPLLGVGQQQQQQPVVLFSQPIAESVLLLFLQQFKEQAQHAIDEFAYRQKGSENVLAIVDYNKLVGNNVHAHQSIPSALLFSSSANGSKHYYLQQRTLGAMSLPVIDISSSSQVSVPSQSSLPSVSYLSSGSTGSNSSLASSESLLKQQQQQQLSLLGNNSSLNPIGSNAGGILQLSQTNSSVAAGNNSISGNSGSANVPSALLSLVQSVNVNSSNTIPNAANSTISSEGALMDLGLSAQHSSGACPVGSNKMFEQLLIAFANVAKHSVNPIVDALYDWRVHLECKPPISVREKIEEYVKQTFKKSAHSKQENDLIQYYTERKEVAADYIFCCVLLLLLSSFSEPELAPRTSELLENLCIQISKKSAQTTTSLVESKKRVYDMFSEIIGLLSGKRFQSITDALLDYTTNPNSTKIEAVQYIRATKYIRLQLAKPDQIAKSTNFLKKLFDFFSKTKKSDIKIAAYEAGASFLSPLGAYEYKSGVDYKDWFEMIKKMLQFSSKYTKKTKYQLQVYPFVSTLMCLSSPKSFLEIFWPHMEALFRFLAQRDKAYKLMTLDCIIHVLGFFMKIFIEGKQEMIVKTGQEKLQKSIENIFYSGRKASPLPSNDTVYDGMVDIIVMIANHKLDFAINNVILSLLKTEMVFSENVYIGFRAIMVLIDQFDVNKVTALLEEDRKTIDKYPPWIVKLLERAKRNNTNDLSSDESDTIAPNTVRIVSPFSSYRTLSSTFNGTINSMSTFGSTTISKMYNANLLMSQLGLSPYQEELCKQFSHILQYCDTNFGQLLLLQQLQKPLNETLSKDKFAGLKVFVAAISCIPRLTPNGLTPQQLMDMLCRCVIHQHKDVRDVTWDVMLQLMEFQPKLSSVLIQSFTEVIVVIDDFKTALIEDVLLKLLILLRIWIDNLSPEKATMKEKFKSPTVYGDFKNYVDVVPFDIFSIEAAGLNLLCNIDGNIRARVLELFPLLRIINYALSKQHDTTVADIIEEIAQQTIEKLYIRYTKTPQHDSVCEFLRNQPQLLPDFLREIAKSVSNYCPTTARIALFKMAKRVTKLNDRLATANNTSVQNDQDIEMWRNFITFSCGLAVEETRNISDVNKRKSSKEIESPRDLYDLILPNLKNSNEKQLQAAVDALGGIHEAMLEILFEQLKIHEADARKPKRTRKDFLRIQISRIYARISESISNTLLRERDSIKERFLVFIDEQLQYLTLPANLYNIDLLPLRYNLFMVIENVAKKLYYFPPMRLRTLDYKMRENLLHFVIRWTGFGDANRKRETEELDNIKSGIEKYKDEEEKKKMENAFKRRAVTIKTRACTAMAALMLGNFFEPNVDKLREWSKLTRIQAKQSNAIDPSGVLPSTSKDMRSKSGSFQALKTPFPFFIPTIGTTRKENENMADSVADQSDSKGITVMKWLDEVLCSKDKLSVNIGRAVIENMLESNPYLLEICIDQCFHSNKRISKSFFASLVEVLGRKEIECNPATLITLCLYQSIAPKKETRNYALKLLQLISNRWFNENEESGNYPFLISCGLLDLYDQVQYTLSEKLASDHPIYAYDVLDEIFKRLEFLPTEEQRSLLRCSTSFLHFVKVDFREDEKPIDTQTPAIPLQQSSSITLQSQLTPGQRALDVMFIITCTYGDAFPKECGDMWIMLSEDQTNIEKIAQSLMYRGSKFDTDNYQMFTVCQKIVSYVATKSPRCIIDPLVGEMKTARGETISHQQHRIFSPSSDGLIGAVPATITGTSNIGNVKGPLTLDRSDVALVLLVEVVYSVRDEIRMHLPLLLQYAFIRVDHKLKILSENAKLLLVHLLHSFVINVVSHNTTTIGQVEILDTTKRLVDYIMQHKTRTMWKRDRIGLRQLTRNDLLSWQQQHKRLSLSYSSPMDYLPTTISIMSPNVQQLSSVVERVVNVFRLLDIKVQEQWGAEALRWATRSHSIHNVVRSYQIYRTLKPELKRDDVIRIIQDIHIYLEETFEDDEQQQRIKIAIVIEIIESLRVLINTMDSQQLILFPQLFWLCVALLHTDVIHIYIHALKLLSALIHRIDFRNESVQHVIIASSPQLDNSIPVFKGVQPMVFRGLLNPFSEPLAIELFSYFSLLPCDFIFESNSSIRLLMNMIGLLPRLCIHMEELTSPFSSCTQPSSSSPSLASVTACTFSASSMNHSCYTMAARLAEACEQHKLKKIAKVFLRYSKGFYESYDKLLLDLRKPMTETFFPAYEEEIFNVLEQMLTHGMLEYQRAVLDILHSILLHVDMSKSLLGKRESLIATISSLIHTPIWQHATRVLDVAVRSSCKGIKDNKQLQFMHYVSSSSSTPAVSVASGAASSGSELIVSPSPRNTSLAMGQHHQQSSVLSAALSLGHPTVISPPLQSNSLSSISQQQQQIQFSGASIQSSPRIPLFAEFLVKQPQEGLSNGLQKKQPLVLTLFGNKPHHGTRIAIKVLDKILESWGIKTEPETPISTTLSVSSSFLSLLDKIGQSPNEQQQRGSPLIVPVLDLHRLSLIPSDMGDSFALDGSEIELSENDDDESEFTEDFTDLTDSEAVSSNKSARLTMDFDSNENEESSVRDFEKQLEQQLANTRLELPYLAYGSGYGAHPQPNSSFSTPKT